MLSHTQLGFVTQLISAVQLVELVTLLCVMIERVNGFVMHVKLIERV